jgi:lipopolysaccharide/colanic/teichoic acid biosynthesis glycosyltransferase
MSSVAVEEDRATAQPRALTLAAYRSVDLLVALVGIGASAPLLLAIGIAIRLEGGGPAIFRQRRLGREQRQFTIHKFRTMRVQADPEVHRQYIEQLIAGDEQTHSDESGRSLYKLAADDRITRVGRFLRKTSLDELPQLFDVLRGHMSLVGPRPVIPYEAELYPAGYDRRFALKPGMTGFWQVSGRNERTYREMIELDVAWVENHSLRLYLSILARTPWVLLSRRGAA